MAKQLRVYKTAEGPKIKCPRCDEKISPEENPLFDGYDCPECNQVIDREEMYGYIAALNDFEDGDDESDSYGGDED